MKAGVFGREVQDESLPSPGLASMALPDLSGGASQVDRALASAIIKERHCATACDIYSG